MYFLFKYPHPNCVKHIVSFSGGKDSSAMLIKMVEDGMHIDDIVFIKVMATPTIGAEFPEMYEYIERMEDYIHRKITVVPSIVSFDKEFHRVYLNGNRKGEIYGFPHTIGAWCNNRLKIKTIQNHYKSYGEHIRYLGIAADETERLTPKETFYRFPLVDWAMTEKDCIDFLNEREMLNPLYKKFRRLGCWFCVKQNLDSLRVIRRDYPDFWNMLLNWDKISINTFKPDCTVPDLERRFAQEDRQLNMFDIFNIEYLKRAA